ncbi:hypothetical protein B0H14DRAFT_2626081 [Mycena olivaceomarginata]|nr:hypothetical protein B0H14DRAFT_2626081 [Mycena olivaceomarginata]
MYRPWHSLPQAASGAQKYQEARRASVRTRSARKDPSLLALQDLRMFQQFLKTLKLARLDGQVLCQDRQGHDLSSFGTKGSSQPSGNIPPASQDRLGNFWKQVDAEHEQPTQIVGYTASSSAPTTQFSRYYPKGHHLASIRPRNLLPNPILHTGLPVSRERRPLLHSLCRLGCVPDALGGSFILFHWALLANGYVKEAFLFSGPVAQIHSGPALPPTIVLKL